MKNIYPANYLCCIDTHKGSYYVTKCGYDTQGNYSYWVRGEGKRRAVKIPHNNLGVKGPKLFNHEFKNAHRGQLAGLGYINVFDALLKYYMQHYEK